jgi:hypothetical protein
MGGGWYLLAKESILPPSAAGGLKRPASLSAGIVLCAGFWFRVHLTSLHSPYNRRRARIARGVVVNDDDRRAVALDGVAENLAHPDVRGVEAPNVHRIRSNQSVARVEVQHPKVLLLQVGHLGHQELRHVGGRAHDKAILRRGQQHTAAQFQGRLDLRRLGLA